MDGLLVSHRIRLRLCASQPSHTLALLHLTSEFCQAPANSSCCGIDKQACRCCARSRRSHSSVKQASQVVSRQTQRSIVQISALSALVISIEATWCSSIVLVLHPLPISQCAGSARPTDAVLVSAVQVAGSCSRGTRQCHICPCLM